MNIAEYKEENAALRKRVAELEDLEWLTDHMLNFNDYVYNR